MTDASGPAPRSTPEARPASARPPSIGKRILARGEDAAREAVFPDLRNMGIFARALVFYVGAVLVFAALLSAQLRDVPLHLSGAFVTSLPVAGVVAALWAAGSGWLRQMAYWQAAALLVVASAVAAAVLTQWTFTPVWHAVLATVAALAALLIYFHTLGRARSPAVTEARLQALHARIRPHFLFNAINAVLGVVRRDPRRAETALEDMADLFRVLMRENRDLQPIGDEIDLTRQYLAIEQLRLGERLQVTWRLDKMPRDALVPALLLQPIAENAVYHGIEPAQAQGEIVIEVARLRSELSITVTNPFLEAAGRHHGGNKMAMGNIRERLALHFDAEARMTSGPRAGRYQVQIIIPYLNQRHARDKASAT
ncbi:MAG: histidine kinase [Burkholderiales bacterium]|nr:histidine kinase [Burkholderiales bacterium]